MALTDKLARMDIEELKQEVRKLLHAIGQDQHLIATLAAACAQGDADACGASDEVVARINRTQTVLARVQAELQSRQDTDEDPLIDRARDTVSDFVDGLLDEFKALTSGGEGKAQGQRRTTPRNQPTTEQQALTPRPRKLPEWMPLAGAGLGAGVVLGLIWRALRKRLDGGSRG